MKTKILVYVFSSFLIITSLIGCSSASYHRGQVHSSTEQELTVGRVQKEIYKGMSGAEVVQSLGSPNIVTKDNSGNETWVYDKVASEASYSNDTGGLFLILGSFSGNRGASATTQRTLTVVIKFDGNSRVSEFSYHSSKF